MSAIIRQIDNAIREHGLFTRGERILLCVSGGADSVAMLAALSELAPAMGITLAVANLNHGIRGRAAAEDQAFVRNLAKHFGLEFAAGKRDVPRLASTSGESLEMAGRRARYDFFVQAARKLRCSAAATAHTADDQAETILLKIVRGSGSDGLRGIPRLTSWRGLRIVRPLRDVDRRTILAFLKARKLAWREDASNRDTAFLRNRVRHEIIPLLESRLNPEFRKALLRLGDIMEEEDAWLESLTEDILAKCSVAPDHMPACGNVLLCKSLAAQPAAARRRVLRYWLTNAGMPRELLDYETTERVDQLLSSGEKPCDLSLPGGWMVRREYGRLTAIAHEKQEAAAFKVRVKVPGVTILAAQQLKMEVSIARGFLRERPPGIGQFPVNAFLSAASWRRRAITVRSWRPGDRINPLGMSGSRKVQDIFTDHRVPKRLRHCLPIFECGGEVIWIPGYRIARGWEVPDPGARALQVKVERI